MEVISPLSRETEIQTIEPLFIVSRLSNQIHLSISGLLIVMGKPVRKTYLSIVKDDWNLSIVKDDWTSILC